MDYSGASAAAGNSSELKLEYIDCPLCGGQDHRPVMQAADQLHGVPGTFHVVKCTACGHRFMNPRPTEETLAACYPAGYGPHQSVETQSVEAQAVDRESAGESAAGSNSDGQAGTPWYLSRGVRAIPGLRWLYYLLTDDRSTVVPEPSGPDAVAVELGCGTGGYLSELKARGWRCQGIELVPAAAETARSRGLEVCCGTLESAGLPAESAEAFAAWHVLEHIPDVRSTLLQVHRILKDDGQLLFSLPNADCWEPMVFRSCWYVWELPRHLHFFGPRSLRRLLGECGFEDIRIVHQRNALSVAGSLGLFLRRFRLTRGIGERLLRYPDRPGLKGQLLLSPLALFAAAVRQGGRLTVTARCRKAARPTNHTSKPA